MNKILLFVLLLAAATGKALAQEWESAAQAAENMTTGLNIGNTLDAYGNWFSGTSPKDYETCWGNPQITPQLIKAYKDGGFNALRLPVTWYQNMDEDGNVREAWMNRVEEVVNYILSEDMYCILNVHHDTGAGSEAWLLADLSNISTIQERFEKLWKQIANRFKDNDHRLLFEGYNEMLDGNKRWTSTDVNGYKAHNQLAQAFVNVVRSTGGNNANRNLLVNTYSADPGLTSTNSFVIPDDSSAGHLIIGAHVYAPGSFTSQSEGANPPSWTVAMQTELEPVLKRLYNKFVKNGYPVIVGEFGANDVPTETERAKYAHFFVSKCVEYGLEPFYWFDIINRNTCEWKYPTLKNVLLGGDIEDIDDEEQPSIPKEGTVIYEGEHQLEYADGGSIFIGPEVFQNVTEGSVLVIEAEKLDAQEAGWWYQMIVYINSPWTKIAEMADVLPLVYTLTADDLEKIKNNGIQIQGHGVVVSKVYIATTSGIETINTEPRQSETVYTLSGIRTSLDSENLPKGIYIIGNKKVLIR